MTDISWLATEAQQLHDIFHQLFFGILSLLLLTGVLVEYFRLPLGGLPSFTQLIGRAIVAMIFLISFDDFTAIVAELTDGLAQKVGDLNNFDLVLSRMGDKLDEYTASWVSVKETVILAMSFLTFFGLYFSIYIAEGIHLFTWTLSYVFSPILIVLFVLPATANATRALYRTIFEVCMWKVVWSVLATLLWSAALNDLNGAERDVNFISVICLNLTLASSVLLTPWVVHALANSGLSGFTRTLGSVAVGAATISPGTIIRATKSTTMRGLEKSKSIYRNSNYFKRQN